MQNEASYVHRLGLFAICDAVELLGCMATLIRQRRSLWLTLALEANETLGVARPPSGAFRLDRIDMPFSSPIYKSSPTLGFLFA